MGRRLSFKRHKALALDRIKHDQLRLAADRLCFFDRRRGSQHVIPVDALYIPAECLPLGLVRSDRLDIGDEAIDLPLVAIQKDRQIIQLLMRPVRVLIIQAHGVIEQNRERVHDRHGAADMAVAKRRDRRQHKLARLPGLCFKKFPFILHKIVPPCPPASAGQFVPR